MLPRITKEIVKLTRDIKNPQQDRRRSGSAALPVFKKGMKFQLRIETHEIKVQDLSKEITTHTFYDFNGDHMNYALPEGHDWYETSDDHSDFVRLNNNRINGSQNNTDLLTIMLEQGLITRKMIELGREALFAKWDAEDL